MQKFVRCEEADFPKYKYLNELGEFNEMPQPFRQIDENEYINLTRNQVPEFREYRQIVLGNPCVSEVNIYYYPQCAVAIAYPDNWHSKDGRVTWNEGLRYYRIGCNHQWRDMTEDERHQRDIRLYRGDHAKVCDSCGQVWCYPSDD